MSGPKKNPVTKLLAEKMSILNWVPDLDEVQKTLEGTVPSHKDDVVSRGGRQWPMKPE